MLFLQLTDVHGNRATFSDLSSYGMPDSIEIITGVETAPPTLNAISIDKVTVDVSEEPQIIKVTVDASDESGIDWSAGSNKTNLVFQDSSGGFHYVTGNDNNPGELSYTVTSDDVGGSWQMLFLQLTDVHGNQATFFDLSSYGMPESIYVLKTDEPTSDISLSYSGLYETLGKNYDYEMLVTATNLAPEPTSSLDLSISSGNILITSVNRKGGSQACSIASTNYNSTVSCSTSAIAANSSAVFRVAVTAGEIGFSWLNLRLVGNTPDISLLDNYVYVARTIEPSVDSDNDGISDQLDAFPLDPTETTDTDSDGIGDNADTDDDGDGYSDSYESSAGTDPLDANSYPEVTDEETGGMPIWMYYIVTQPEASSKSAP